MKQLLHYFQNEHDDNNSNDDDDDSTRPNSKSSSYFVVGLRDRAFVGRFLFVQKDDNNNDNNDKKSVDTSCQLVELQKPTLMAAASVVAEQESTRERVCESSAGNNTNNNNNNNTGDMAANEDEDDDDDDEEEHTEQVPTTSRTNHKQQQDALDPWQIQAVVGTIDYFPQQQEEQQPSAAAATANGTAVVDATVSQTEEDMPQLAIIVAVTYYNKTLAIYRIERNELEHAVATTTTTTTTAFTSTSFNNVKVIPPITVYHSSKRVGSLCFARVPPSSSSPPSLVNSSLSTPPTPLQHQQHHQQQQQHLVVVITGDLAGDAFAYSLAHHQDTNVSTSKSSSSIGNDNDPTMPKLKVSYKEKENPEEDDGTCSSYRRLLLGHTASMLTAVECTTTSSTNNTQLLLTADRDEKIRISSWPNTHEIHGYLLGHAAFISSMTIIKQRDDNINIVVSCGGDCFLRVWDYQKCIELVSLDLSKLSRLHVSGIPSKVAATVIVNDANVTDDPVETKKLQLRVMVIYDKSMNMHIFQVTLPLDSCTSDGNAADTTTTTIATSQTAAATIREVAQISLPAQPLAISMLSSSQVLVLMRDPEYLQVYNIPFDVDTDDKVNSVARTTTTGNSEEQQPVAACCRLLQDIAQTAYLQLPDTVLEKDRFGNYKMQKNIEKRGPAHEMPWNNVRRKDTAREQTRRARKNRNSRKRQKNQT